MILSIMLTYIVVIFIRFRDHRIHVTVDPNLHQSKEAAERLLASQSAYMYVCICPCIMCMYIYVCVYTHELCMYVDIYVCNVCMMSVYYVFICM